MEEEICLLTESKLKVD